MSSARHLEDASLLGIIAGDLEPSAAKRARTHLAACPTCRRALDAFREVHGGLLAARVESSSFASARMTRALGQALSGREASRPPRLVRRSTAVIAVAFAAVSGAALALTAIRAREPSAPSPPPSAASAARVPALVLAPPTAVALPLVDLAAEPAAAPRSAPEVNERPPRDRERAPPGPERLASLAPPRAPAPGAPAASDPARPAAPFGVRVAVAPGTPSPEEALQRAWEAALADEARADWLALGDAYAQAGALQQAADAWVRGLSEPAGETAAQRLSTVTREGLLPADALLSRLSAAERPSAALLRLRCEAGLRYRGDRAAVDACRAFGRAYPAHPAVRGLAMAAGQVAETRLQDLPLAVAEYSRAIMVSEYAGLPSTDALLARARARAALGDREEAQADLRLYLHVSPEAYRRPEVRRLAEGLDVPAP